MAEESEAQTKEILGDDFVPFMDAIPEIREFLAKVEAREKENAIKYPEKLKKKDKIEKKDEEEVVVDEEGEKEVKPKKKEMQMPIEEVEFNPETFNPFDMKEIRKSEEAEKPMKPRKLLHVKK